MFVVLVLLGLKETILKVKRFTIYSSCVSILICSKTVKLMEFEWPIEKVFSSKSGISLAVQYMTK
tara:strand:+ start:218 stop:412 length:195 start_codon:yes stop_codon:yes gene_type:complete